MRKTTWERRRVNCTWERRRENCIRRNAQTPKPQYRFSPFHVLAHIPAKLFLVVLRFIYPTTSYRVSSLLLEGGVLIRREIKPSIALFLPLQSFFRIIGRGSLRTFFCIVNSCLCLSLRCDVRATVWFTINVYQVGNRQLRKVHVFFYFLEDYWELHAWWSPVLRTIPSAILYICGRDLHRLRPCTPTCSLI